jgi:predicted small metal-binding protein
MGPSIKTMSCSQLGGKCSQKLSAYAWEGILKAMTKHVTEKHPKALAKNMYKRNHEEPERWAREMRPK